MDAFRSRAIVVIELLSLYLICFTAVVILKTIYGAITGINISGIGFVLIISVPLWLAISLIIAYTRCKVRRVVTAFFSNKQFTTEFRWIRFNIISCYHGAIPIMIMLRLRFIKKYKRFWWIVYPSWLFSLPQKKALDERKIEEIQHELDNREKEACEELWDTYLTGHSIVTNTPLGNLPFIEPDKYFGLVSSIIDRYGIEVDIPLASTSAILKREYRKVLYRLVVIFFSCYLSIMICGILIRVLKQLF